MEDEREEVENKPKNQGKKKSKEYSKRLLNFIVINSVIMMYGTYILAWFDKIEIAETLSKTIATAIISVVVGYLAKSTIENISKNTTAFGENVPQIKSDDDEINPNRDC